MKTFLNKALCTTLLTVVAIAPIPSNAMDSTVMNPIVKNIDSIVQSIKHITPDPIVKSIAYITPEMCKTAAKGTALAFTLFCVWRITPQAIRSPVYKKIEPIYTEIKTEIKNYASRIKNYASSAIQSTLNIIFPTIFIEEEITTGDYKKKTYKEVTDFKPITAVTAIIACIAIYKYL